MRRHGGANAGTRTNGASREPLDAVLAGGGEVGRLMREIDWAATPLGPMTTWKQSLRSALSICVSSRFPIVMYWGSELTVLYNDAYSGILGAKHPWALGKPCKVCWAEIWDTIGPMLHNVVDTGEATWSDDLQLMLQRNGVPEECYFSFSFSPVRVESGEVGGVFTAVVETTQRVLSDRRLRLLTQLGERSAGARSVQEAIQRCVEALEASDPRPLPFALFYLSDGEGAPRLSAMKGVSNGDAVDPARWPFAEVARTGKAAFVRFDASLLEPTTPWAHDTPPAQAVVLPIGLGDPRGTEGFIVAGVNPLRPLDEAYQSFFDLMAKQASGAVADAQAYEAENRRAESLSELDRAKTEFFSNVSHEFRTPLTLLLGPLDSLTSSVDPGSAQAEQLDLIRRNALRLLKLVTTLLDFSRIDAIRHEARLENIDLGTYTADLASVFRSAVDAAGLRLVIDCPSVGAPVAMDRDIWENIVLNLLSNALKFTVEGEIAVRVRAVAGVAELTVADTGIGIPQEELPHVFDRFYRVRGTAGRTQEGAGIGLALVKELVGIVGGSISVSSTLGAGTEFTVAVPLSEGAVAVRDEPAGERRQLARSAFLAEAAGWLAPAVHPSAGAAVTAGETTGRILLVDDNADMRAYVAHLLSEKWDVEAVADGVEALEAARRRRPDLVLTDVMMPRMDGFQLLGALRADVALRDVPVVMLSARAGQESAVEGLAGGADDYLVKPFTEQELLARVHANLSLSSMRTELARARAEARAAGERAAFLNTAAHELRTPLTVIGGYLDLLLDGTLDRSSDEARHALARIAHKTHEGVRLVEQMLVAARLESNTSSLRRTSLDLRELVRAAVVRASGLARLESKTVIALLPPAPVVVDVDASLIGIVLDNVLVNALYNGGPRIKVNVQAEPPLVTVADTVLGTDTGMGIELGRRLAELHGGTLRLEQSGDGASFALSLPAADTPEPGAVLAADRAG